MAGTRKVLERVPGDKLDWQPHPESHTIGWSANHRADLAGRAEMTLRKDSLDLKPPGGQPLRDPKLTIGREILAAFDHPCTVPCLYSRLTDIPVRGFYGLSGDE